jgi:hypothetical protein
MLAPVESTSEELFDTPMLLVDRRDYRSLRSLKRKLRTAGHQKPSHAPGRYLLRCSTRLTVLGVWLMRDEP